MLYMLVIGVGYIYISVIYIYYIYICVLIIEREFLSVLNAYPNLIHVVGLQLSQRWSLEAQTHHVSVR